MNPDSKPKAYPDWAQIDDPEWGLVWQVVYGRFELVNGRPPTEEEWPRIVEWAKAEVEKTKEEIN